MSLQYVHIPQYEYKVNGIPAMKCGEWAGHTSSKWKGSLRVIHPENIEKVFNNDSPVLNRNRRHFSATQGKESFFHPGKRLFTEKKSLVNIEAKKVGLKKIDQNVTQTKMWFERKHFEEQFGFNNDPEVLHIKTFRPDGNTRTFTELTLEKELGIKKQIPELKSRRNGMHNGAPGDKSYRQPEHLPDFYKEGGLVVGSTNVKNQHKTLSKKANDYYDTLDINKKVLNRKKIWRNKLRLEEENFDNVYVKTLGNWEKNVLMDYLPKVTEPNKNKGVISPKKGGTVATPAKKPVVVKGKKK